MDKPVKWTGAGEAGASGRMKRPAGSGGPTLTPPAALQLRTGASGRTSAVPFRAPLIAAFMSADLRVCAVAVSPLDRSRPAP